MSNDFDEQLIAVSRTASQVAADCRGRRADEVLHSFGSVGLLGAIASEDVGGLSLPIEFASAIVAAVAAELLADPIAEALLCTRFVAPIDTDIATGIGAGKVFATLSLHEGLIASRRDGALSISGTVRNVVFGQEARYLLAQVAVDGQAALILLDLEAAGVTRRDAETLDLERSRTHLAFHDVAVAADRISGEAAEVHSFRNAGLILFSHWLESHASACLSRTSEYLSSRRQFGHPLTSLQAVRFSLAQCALELENLHMLMRGAIAEFGASDSLQSGMAYAYAAAVCPAIAEKCLQLNGGMGYTWEVPIHRFLRRIRALADDHTAAAGRERVTSLALDVSCASLSGIG